MLRCQGVPNQVGDAIIIKNHIPQIPWLAKYGKDPDLAHGKMTSIIQGERKQQWFINFCEAIPIFLPRR
jgi:hypothetical protein